MSWRPLSRFRDAAVPKLDNLRRAAAAGLRLPPTWWAEAQAVAAGDWPEPTPPFPLIVRSSSPTEDGRTPANAAQLLSLVADRSADFAPSLRAVADALPRDTVGRPRGYVFVQPVVRAAEAGVAFFDGFYFERTAAAGGNFALTAGQSRGRVLRGHLHRDDPWS